ncbi:MAG: helix-turn-helix transcriptional regulator [Alphaproteobacteria bacterium]|nr:helix-turn-helix transcriptional regulator [Alphaproteobacteria bacterium]
MAAVVEDVGGALARRGEGLADTGRRPLQCRSRAALIAAAARLLRTTPYEALGLERVAAEAGVTRRTLYNQFAHKEDLYRSLMEPRILAVAAQLETQIPLGPRPHDAIWLFATRTALVLGGPDNVDVVRCVIRDGGRLPWLSEAYTRHVRQPILSAIELWLLRFPRRDPALDAAQIAECAAQFLFLLEGLTVSPHLHPAPNIAVAQLSGERAIDAIVAAFLQRAGLAAGGEVRAGA